MFDPIVAPDAHRGPATGHTSEFGTTWQECVSRINGAFKTLFERGESAATGVSAEFTAALEARFEQAEDALSDALFKIDALEAKLAAYVGIAPSTDVSDPPDQSNPSVTSSEAAGGAPATETVTDATAA
jgi:hypothetical protein